MATEEKCQYLSTDSNFLVEETGVSELWENARWRILWFEILCCFEGATAFSPYCSLSSLDILSARLEFSCKIHETPTKAMEYRALALKLSIAVT